MLLRGALLCAAAAASATTVTYTPTGGALNATDFNAWLVSNGASGADTLVLTPGTYAVAPPTSATDGAHVYLNGPLSNALVVMDGVTLVMADRGATAVLVRGWVNSTLRGLTTSYAELPSNQAAIVGISPDGLSFTVQVPVGYPLGDWTAGTVAACNVFDPGSRWWKPGTFDLSPSSLTPLGDPSARTFVMNFTHDCGPGQENVAVRRARRGRVRCSPCHSLRSRFSCRSETSSAAASPGARLPSTSTAVRTRRSSASRSSAARASASSQRGQTSRGSVAGTPTSAAQSGARPGPRALPKTRS